MDKNSEKNVRFRINITLLIAVVLLVADLYAMINMPQKFIILAIITALFLVAISSGFLSLHNILIALL